MNSHQPEELKSEIRRRYAAIADSAGSCGCSAECCSPTAGPRPAASALLGYSPNEISAVPEGADLGLGCGNPQAMAELKEGETVIDLGCGGGFDCFLAARRVGSAGRVIGVDMTEEMIGKARANAAAGGFSNVEFRVGEIEDLPVADETADAILSNCVINLSPDKPRVFSEAFRVLRSSGRLAISDVVAVAPLPEGIKANLQAHSGCLAGCVTVPETEAMLKAAGFTEVRVRVIEESSSFIKDWFPGSGAERFVRSARIEARKPVPGVL